MGLPFSHGSDIQDMAIVSHTQAVARIISDTQWADTIMHGRVGDLTTKAGDDRQ
jgi:hypothetical protein